MTKEQGILSKPLESRALPDRDRPLVAHIKALLAVFNGESVPQDVREVVLKYANRYKDDLSTQFVLWDKTIDLGIAEAVEKIAFDNLAAFMTLSYGPEEKKFLEMRRTDLSQAFQIGGLEDLENRRQKKKLP